MFKEYMADALQIVALRQFWFKRMFFGKQALPKKHGGICWQPKLAPTGLTGLTERSDWSMHYGLSGRDRPVWPVGPTGLTGLGRVRVQLGFFINLDLVIGFFAGQVHPPYKYKGPRPIETSNRSKYINTLIFLCLLPLLLYLNPNSFQPFSDVLPLSPRLLKAF